MGAPSSNKEWLFWGRTDPLFGVVSWPGKNVSGMQPWTREEFLATGRAYFADVWRQWQQYGVGEAHCVEVGCGAGRITRQLVDQFAHVTALDVSPDQLTVANEFLGEARARVVLERVSEPRIPLADGSADGVFSCEVFQHFQSDAPFHAYISEAFRVLRPGGTLCFQVPVVGMHRWTFLASRTRAHMLRLLRAMGRRRMMIYRAFQAPDVIDVLERVGFREVEIRTFQVADHGVHSYFFARKA